jgi:hypothetical protein
MRVSYSVKVRLRNEEGGHGIKYEGRVDLIVFIKDCNQEFFIYD